jgi:uncharacterized membrane protein YbhN (UPF0104 family)
MLFIAVTMQFVMVVPANRNREFIAYFAPQRFWLGELQMVRSDRPCTLLFRLPRLLPQRPQNHTQAGEIRTRPLAVAFWVIPLRRRMRTMRRFLLLSFKILVSTALLYLALRKVDFHELASRFNVTSLGWIGLAIAATFLQIFIGMLRWREVGGECGAPLGTMQAMRFNLIGTFFNQTLPSSIGGDAVRLWLVARDGAGWRAATYSIFVDRAIGLIALAIIIVASLPWSYQLIADPRGRLALLLVDFAALTGGLGFLVLGRLQWLWLKHWWAMHHIHACSVIANRIIFGRQRGPKARFCRFWCIFSPSSPPGVWCDRSRHPCCSGRPSS